MERRTQTKNVVVLRSRWKSKANLREWVSAGEKVEMK